jgi:hypothetical protein
MTSVIPYIEEVEAEKVSMEDAAKQWRSESDRVKGKTRYKRADLSVGLRYWFWQVHWL